MPYKRIAIGACCTIALVAGTSSADNEATDYTPHRELAGHVFIPSLIVADPFVSTYVGIFTAAGYSWIDGPDFNAGGNLILGRNLPLRERSYSAEAMAQAVSLQFTITDEVAFRLVGGGGLNGGNNGRSALVVGMIEPLTAGAGVTYSWQPGPIARFGLTLDFIYAHTKLIQPLMAIQSSLVAGQVVPSAASDTINSYSVAPGIAFAAAPAPRFGVLASAQYSWTGLTDGVSRSLNYVSLGASAQLDYEPLGLLASYRAQVPFDSDSRFTHTIEAGVFYTGRKELTLGLEAQVRWFDLRPDRPLHLDTTQLIGVAEMRYHWN